ncbi:DUF2273 domain-containing protein [Leuconostoc suionicum]|uniref:Small integral membrane protein (DUF2273) n=1 Tax=Leuconostoc suionicum TaxID=1511761 RepID=A0A2N9KAA3_9LACO|nr:MULTISPECIES: DUF2273 domain-containing protein [Leuconostoc]API71915.1 hypothetical protein A6B45_04170 [Leuconostoc suionicum]MBE4728280.1 DUF2273 domain-containing protein [Leuconostoc suionicum]MCT4402164.1 DUF2273 domain-containing protein [Leuconostoc suionicum]MDC2805324.1 DUF2273 domain-containing protein [Leuconostoc suionicum]MDC2822836.1 DUF2273 domain-containing protein [Leuconostoc suionicum]
MKDKKSINIWVGGLAGFILSTLLVTVGFWKTILIIVVTLLAGWIGYLLDAYNVDLSIVSKIFTRKN